MVPSRVQTLSEQLTAQISDTSEEIDEFVEAALPLRFSERERERERERESKATERKLILLLQNHCSNRKNFCRTKRQKRTLQG